MKQRNGPTKESIEATNAVSLAMMGTFDFDAHHVRCANCRNAVTDVIENGLLVTRCAKNQGRSSRAMPQVRLIERFRPWQWRKASECPDFTCMTDDCDKHVGQQ